MPWLGQRTAHQNIESGEGKLYLWTLAAQFRFIFIAHPCRARFGPMVSYRNLGKSFKTVLSSNVVWEVTFFVSQDFNTLAVMGIIFLIDFVQVLQSNLETFHVVADAFSDFRSCVLSFLLWHFRIGIEMAISRKMQHCLRTAQAF